MTEDKAKVNEQHENEKPDVAAAQEESVSGKKEAKKDKTHKKSKVEEQLGEMLKMK